MADQATIEASNAQDDLLKRLEELERRIALKADPTALNLVAFSGELDRLLAAFVIATGAAACGMKVSMFFTFWATTALKKAGRQSPGKPLMEKLFGWMLPGGPSRLKLSRLDMMGMGRRMLGREMRQKGVPNLRALISMAGEHDVEINVCEMAMSLLGTRPDELIDYPGLKVCGVSSFLERCSTANTTLFI